MKIIAHLLVYSNEKFSRFKIGKKSRLRPWTVSILCFFANTAMRKNKSFLISDTVVLLAMPIPALISVGLDKHGNSIVRVVPNC